MMQVDCMQNVRRCASQLYGTQRGLDCVGTHWHTHFPAFRLEHCDVVFAVAAFSNRDKLATWRRGKPLRCEFGALRLRWTRRTNHGSAGVPRFSLLTKSAVLASEPFGLGLHSAP